jgi:hypothetical protein
MKCARKAAAVILIALLALPLLGQSERESIPGKAAGCLAGAEMQSGDRQQFHAMRIIKDPGTRQCWLLESGFDRPATPARLVLLPSETSCAGPDTKGQDGHLHGYFRNQSIPVIRAGDTLILSEHTSVSDIQLEAIALSAAAIGEALTVRLKIGGRPLHAIATAADQASLPAGAWETRP